MRAWLVLLLLTPAFAGCLQGESGDEGDGDLAKSGVGNVTDRIVRFDGNGTPLALPDHVAETWFNLTGYNGAEPTMGITSSGAIFATAGDQTIRSLDEGETWEVVYEIGLDDEGLPTDRVYRSWDPMMWVDPVTDIVYTDPMFPPLACTNLAWSEDDGETWTTNPAVCHPPPMDHQKLFTGVPGPDAPPYAGVAHETVLYQCYNQLVQTECSMSYDGGLTWPLTTTAANDYLDGCGGINGHGTVSADGIGAVPLALSCDQIGVSFSTDSGLTWTYREAPFSVGAESFDADLAFDANGTLHAMWRGSDQVIYLARTPDLGETWEGPFRVSPPDVTSAMFQAMSLGDVGRAGLAFLGTRDTDKSPGDAPAETRWHLFIVTTEDSTAEVPEFTAYQVTPDEDPVHVGLICLEGINCNGGRNLLEFIDTAISPDGTFHVIYTEGCVDACAENPSQGESTGRHVALAKLLGWPLTG